MSPFWPTTQRYLKSVAWRDNTRKVLKMRTNQVSTRENRVSSFEKPPFFYIHLSKEFWEMIYFSRNIIAYSKSTDQQHLHVQFKANLSEVQYKFWGDKKGPMEGFILSWISIFVSSLSFELSKLILYLWRFVLKSFVRDCVNWKEIEIIYDLEFLLWIIFKNWNVFASLSKVTTKCTAKNREA